MSPRRQWFTPFIIALLTATSIFRGVCSACLIIEHSVVYPIFRSNMSKAYSVFVCLLLVHSLTYDFCNGLVSNSERSVKVHIAHVLNSRELVAGNGDVKPQIQFVGPFVYE